VRFVFCFSVCVCPCMISLNLHLCGLLLTRCLSCFCNLLTTLFLKAFLQEKLAYPSRDAQMVIRISGGDGVWEERLVAPVGEIQSTTAEVGTLRTS